MPRVVELNLDVICIQDLTWVNGEILALYIGENTNFYIERWANTTSHGSDHFWIVNVMNPLLLDYLSGKISLLSLLTNCTYSKQYLKSVKGKYTTFYSLQDTFCNSSMPKRDSHLQNSTDFLNDDKYNIVRQIYTSAMIPTLQSISKKFNIGPIINLGQQ